MSPGDGGADEVGRPRIGRGVFSGFAPPLQIVGFIGTKRTDPERGPLVRMRSDDALIRLLTDGELVRVMGPRRTEYAVLVIDDDLPRGGVVVRDLAGLTVTEIVRVTKADLSKPRRP
jgi:hypothetical protein